MSQGVTLITGANGGVGSQIATYLLENGHRNIACNYRSSNEEISSIFKKYDLDASKHTFASELVDEIQIKTMRENIESKLGPVQNLINVAGASANAMSWKITKTEFQKVFDENVMSTFLCSREFVPGMRERCTGRIINFSSIVGFTGVLGAAHYCAAKAALVGLTKAMALELANKKVSVNAIALGYFNTGLIESVPEVMQEQIKTKIPLARFGEKNDVGAMVQYLISSDAGFVTGQILHLNGGQY